MGQYSYDKKLIAVGDKVVLRKVELNHEVIQNGIVIPDKFTQSGKLCKGIVESVGRDAAKEGIKTGDKVMFDDLATFGETYPICVIKMENIICYYEDEDEK